MKTDKDVGSKLSSKCSSTTVLKTAEGKGDILGAEWGQQAGGSASQNQW